MKNILICGATGFIGRNMTLYFAKDSKYKVFAVRHIKPSFHIEEAKNDVTWLDADLRNYDDVKRILNNIDIVIQAAATTSGSKDIVSKPYIHVTDNALMNSILFRESMNLGIKHFIFFSCTVMYKSSENPIKEIDWDESMDINDKYFGIANTKIYIEKMLDFYSRVSEMKTTAIRHSNIYGPFDKFDLERSHVFGATISKVLTANKDLEVWGTGEEKRDLLHVDDLISFVRSSISNQSKKYQLYNCGYGKSISIKDLVNLIVYSSKKDLEIKYDFSKPTIKTNICLDNTLAEYELQWQPKVLLEDGILRTIKWWQDNIDPKTLIMKKSTK